MNINSNKNNPKTDNLPILRSTSKETKKRFDNLLKNALIQKNEARKTSVSPTKLKDNNNKNFEKQTTGITAKIKENETTSATEDSKDSKEDEIPDAKNPTENNINKENYIMEKFLSDATSIKQEDKAEPPLTNIVTFIKPPVPLPRSLKKIQSTDESSSTSNLTYSISTPKITNTELLDDIDRLSFSTASTYNIRNSSRGSLSPQMPNNMNIEDPRHQVSTVGDIIIHSAETSMPSKQIINIVEQKNMQRKVSTKIDVSKLQLCEIQEIIDNKYKEIEKRRNTESQSFKDGTLNTIGGHEEDTYVEETSISTSKLRTQSNSAGGIKPYNYEYLIGVVVYRCDKLTLSNYVNHPCVKVHVVDSVTGKYLRRSRNNEEQANDLTTAHVYPLITKAYNMQEKRSFVPYWEEILTFDEDFDYMMDYENPVIIFFEILDFLSFADANIRYSAEGSYSGWHKIAWAFLKPIGKGYLNIEQKLRLQLYKPKKSILLKTSKECMLYDWWKNGDYTKYPSSIHVCIKRVKNMEQENTINLNKVKKAHLHNYEIDIEPERDSDTYSEKIRPKCQIRWTKKSSHACKIPTKTLAEYKTPDKGCFIVKFSNDGYLLAGGVVTLTKYPIYVYSITDANIYCKFKGHEGLVYDFNWSANDVYLISAASDCTVCIWNVSTKEYYPIQTLPHPSFVYCVLLKMLEDIEIITGCYDKILRVWRAENKVNVGTNYNLKQEVEGHIGYITSICSRRHENIMYSSDSLGVVIEWHFVGEQWTLGREFKFKEYLNTIINKIILHPKTDKLFVFCRDSTIRLIDLNVNCILQWYKGALNDRLLLTGCVTPCGTYVFASSEDGTICIWNSNTGLLSGTYNPYMRKSKILTIPYCIEYHPFDHMVTFCHYGLSIPILLCIFHRSYIDVDLQFQSLEEVCAVKTEKRTKKCKKKKVVVGESIKKNANVSLGGIIEKIDDVLVSAKT